MKKFASLILIICFSAKLMAQGDGAHGMHSAMQAGNPYYSPNQHPQNRPAKHTGGSGAAIASRSGYTVGITTASIIAGTAVVVLLSLAALALADNSAHAH